MQKVICSCVLRENRCHGSNNRQIIDTCGDMREQIADRYAALTVLPELPRTLHDRSDIVELRRRNLHLYPLAMFPIEARLWIKRVNLGRSTIHVKHNDTGCTWSMMCQLWRH